MSAPYLRTRLGLLDIAFDNADIQNVLAEITDAAAGDVYHVYTTCPGRGWTPMAKHTAASGQEDAPTVMSPRHGRTEEIAAVVLW